MGKWNFEWSEKDDTHNNWGHSNESRADDFTNHHGDGGLHCHLWVNHETGESGVEHRGACKVCDDEGKVPEQQSDNEADASGGK